MIELKLDYNFRSNNVRKDRLLRREKNAILNGCKNEYRNI